MRALILSLVAVLTLAQPARPCDIALALAVDVSGSVDPGEYRTQMRGLAEALRDGAVAEALVRAQARVILIQWTGSSRQKVTLPWVQLRSFADVDALADRVADAPRRWRKFSTAIGEALDFTLAQFDDIPACKRRIIDVSGDGISNEGQEPRAVHPRLREAGITVNALAIEEDAGDLTAWFFENLITGEGAFVVTADGFADYPARIRLKLYREVTRAVSCAGKMCANVMPLSRDEG